MPALRALEFHRIKTTWTDLKALIDIRHPLQYDSATLGDHFYYKVFIKKNNNKYFANIYSPNHPKHNASDYNDFVNNYKPDIDKYPPNDTGLADGGKILVHQTSRIVGTTTYFTGASDDQADPSRVGGDVPESQKLKGHHEIGNSTTESAYLDMNMIINDTYMHEGYLQWYQALNDELSVEVVPSLATVSPGTNTFFNLVGGYLVVPAAGDGTVNLDNMVLTEMPLNETGRRSTAYWNADYNTTTKVFENLTAAPLGDGQFNMFTVEIVIMRFANKVPILGSGFMNLQTSDASRVGHGMRIKVTAHTRGADHEWWWNAFATMHRKTTV